MTEHDHGHPHPQQVQQGPRQPSGDTILRTQKEEIDRINDNRIFLLSMISELEQGLNAAHVEIASLQERLEQYEASEAAAEAKPEEV